MQKFYLREPLAGWMVCMTTLVTAIGAIGPENIINLLPEEIRVSRTKCPQKKHLLLVACVEMVRC